MTPELIAGRYRVQRAVGSGGMGTVWLCQDELLGRDVAVKQVGQLPGESSTDTARAMREARSSAALNHRNVVSVFDVVEESDRIWLVMEYVPSRTLSQLLAEEGPIPPERAAAIGAQVAEGLTAAHAAGTIHRDVKPGNILVGDGDRAKVSDFGIARRSGDPQLTSTGLMTGTPAYFSPELARGEDPGPESDVWALGATLYTAVEGHPPFPEQRNPLAMLQTIAAQAPAPAARAGALTEPIARMLDRDPASRWSMADAAHALRRAAERDASGTPLLDTGDRTTQAMPATAGAAGAAGASGASGASTGAGAAAREGSSSGTATPGPAPRGPDRRRRGPSWLVVATLVAVLVGAVALVLGLLANDRLPVAQQERREASSASVDPSPEGSDPDASPQPSPEPSEETSSDKPSPSPEPGPTEEGEAAQVDLLETYFSLVPDDTDEAWQLLAPSMRSVGRGDYESFWDSVDEVQLSDPAPGSGETVDVTLTYTFDDGRVVQERQRISLERGGDGYLITDDEVLSSRTVRG